MDKGSRCSRAVRKGKENLNENHSGKKIEICILHQNVQGLKNKIGLFNVFLDSTHCDILCFTEVWAKLDEIRSLYIEGYHVSSYYCRTSHERGGISIFVKNSLSSSRLDCVELLSTDLDFECAAIKCFVSEIDYVIVLAVYRSPAGDKKMFLRKLNEALTTLNEKFKNKIIIVCGDFNINFLLPSNEYNQLMDILNSHCFTPTINKPTRINSCIDNICVNINLRKYKSSVINNCISDHSGQKIIFSLNSVDKRITKEIISFRDVNNIEKIANFCEMLAKEDWDVVENCNENTDKKFNDFSQLFTYYFDLAFPITKKFQITNKRTNKWITKGLRTSSKNLKELYLLTLKGDKNIKTYYKQYKKIYRTLINKAKLMHNNSLLKNAKNKSKVAWKILNKRKENIEKTRIKLNLDGEIISEPQSVANCFNNYFNDISHLTGSSTSKLGAVNVNIENNPISFYFEPSTPEDVIHIIDTLKHTNSTGHDNISNNLLKHCKHFIAKPLSTIINCSISEGRFPDKLKIAKIKPLLKKGKETAMENYRPISLLTSFSKIIEKFVATKLTKFFETCNLFNKCQFGFRKELSTMNGITKFLNTLYQNLDKGYKNLGIFLDLSKAFDMVCHKILLVKLEKYGVRGLSLDWFNCYLSRRRHFVEQDGHSSKMLFSTLGVPQGSILGPLLFVIYINDFRFSNSILFADDVSILVSDRDTNSIAKRANEQMTEICNWIAENKLILNNKKSIFVNFNISNSVNDSTSLIRANGASMEQVNSTKFLGLHISSNCSWDTHINTICTKIAPTCYCLRQLRFEVNMATLKILYFAKVHSLLSYGIIAWGSSSELTRLFRLQKRAIRAMTGINSRTSCRQSFKALQILTLPSIFILHLLVYAKTELKELPTLNRYHSYSTRHGASLEIPAHKLTTYERSPNYLAIKAYNKLPKNYKMLANKKFKNVIKDLLIQKSYYSLDEYIEDTL